MSKHFHAIVIGSGGGSKLTRPVASLGHKVAVIEEAEYGGTCLNHGCIPSKMLIHPADVATFIREAHRFEIDVHAPQFRFTELINRVSKTVDADSQSIGPMYDKDPNITQYRCRGRFVGEKTIDVNGEKISADRIFIATGARAHIPAITGLKDTPYMTYKTALRRQIQPKSMIVIGGGYIAVELGYFYGAFGTQMTFLVRSQFLKNEDNQVIEEFTKVFSNRFDVRMNAVPTKVSYENNRFQVTYQTPDGAQTVVEAEALLVATGVVPNSDDLGLHNTPIKVDDQGFIEVDANLQTAVPGVYAFGDIIGRHLFRHAANFEGEYLFTSLYGPQQKPVVYPPMPHAVFSNPQIAGVGATEQELEAQGKDYVVGFNAYKNSAMGMALRSEHGFVKLLFERHTQVLVGAHIIGDEASNMLHMLIAMMTKKATVDDLLEMIYIHPALPEIVRNAARKAKLALIQKTQ